MRTIQILDSEWRITEAPGARDSATVHVPVGVRLQPGTVLAQVTGDARLVAHNEAASDGSQVAVAILGTSLMSGVAGDYPSLVFVGNTTVIAGMLNGGAGISAATAARLTALKFHVRGSLAGAMPGAGTGYGSSESAPPAAPTFRILTRSGNVITTRSGNAITWR